MANKPKDRVPVSRERFKQTLRDKGFTIKALGQAREIDRSEKTISNYIMAGEMPPDLLDRIGRYIDVDPDFLSGVYDRRFEEIKETLPNPEFTRFLWSQTSRFPYSKHAVATLDFKDYILKTLLLCNVSEEQLMGLPYRERRQFQRDLGEAIHTVIKRYFEKDASGKELDIAIATEGILYLLVDWFNPSRETKVSVK